LTILKDLCFSEKALVESEVGIIVLDPSAKVQVWNRWVENASGILFQSAKDHSLSNIFDEPLSARVIKAVNSAICHSRAALLSQKLNQHPFAFYRSDSEREMNVRMDQQVYIKPLDCGAKDNYCLVQISDVTETVRREKVLRQLANDAREAEEGLRIQEAHLRAIFQSTNDSMMTISSDGRIQTFNRKTPLMFGYAEKTLDGKNICDLIAELCIKSQNVRFNLKNRLEEWVAQADSMELLGQRSGGGYFPIDLSISQLELDHEKIYVAVIRDITERKKAEDRMAQLAHYDVLTGLANRVLLKDRMERALQRSKRYNRHFALMFLDLDNFKSLNDLKGHSYGDELLKQVSVRLMDCVRATDTVARWGGDEFVILLESINNALDAATVADKVVSALTPSFKIKHQTFHIGASIGISVFPQCGEDIEAMIKGADTAMYEAKSRTQEQFLFFDQGMNEKMQHRLLLEADLRTAIKEEQFEIYLQPKLDLISGKIHSAEALIRWNHPERGMVFPDEFITLSEETGLIWDIGALVIKASCKVIKQLTSAGYSDFNIAVNLSPLQFQRPEITSLIMKLLMEEGISPKNLELEITEGLLMDQTSVMIELLNQFSNAGFKISIDDFGTGYSSLSYLRKFPLDHLKIDRSFVMDLPEDVDAMIISHAIISLAHSLRLDIIAEGVETLEQLKFMRDNHCRYIQGYYLAKPMSVEHFSQWLENFDISVFLAPLNSENSASTNA